MSHTKLETLGVGETLAVSYQHPISGRTVTQVVRVTAVRHGEPVQIRGEESILAAPLAHLHEEGGELTLHPLGGGQSVKAEIVPLP